MVIIVCGLPRNPKGEVLFATSRYGHHYFSAGFSALFPLSEQLEVKYADIVELYIRRSQCESLSPA